MGHLVPIACEEVIPGDTFRMSSSVMIRLSPMLAPVMTPIRARIHHWFVPYRILDPNWENFIIDNNNTDNYVLPFISSYANKSSIPFLKGQLLDYLGCYRQQSSVNVTQADATKFLAYPAMAYNMIWNEFYRDEDLQDPVEVYPTREDNLFQHDGYGSEPLLRVSWRKDRFTTARPWTQLGEQVFVPTYTSDQTQEYTYYEVHISAKWSPTPDGTSYCNSRRPAYVRDNIWCGVSADNDSASVAGLTANYNTASKIWFQMAKRLFLAKFKDYDAVVANNGATYSVDGQVTQADYDAAGAGTMPDTASGNGQISKTTLTFTFKPYRKTGTISNPGALTWNSSGQVTVVDVGTQYLVNNLSGVIATYSTQVQNQVGSMSIRDLRLSSALQRYQENKAKWGHRYIEYLNFLGIKSSDARLQLPEYLGGGSQLLQISEVLQTTPSEDGVVGSMKGHGIGLMRSNRFTKFFEEHGVILSLLSVVPDSIYVQGTKRYFLKTQWSDFFQKDLQDIGMQEVYNGELYTNGVVSLDKDIFGYQDRYAEYRKGNSYVSGDFHDTLDFWHLGRKFNQIPSLNASFIECNPSMRIFADTESDPLWCFARHSIVAKRMLSKRSNTRLK